MDIQVFEKSLTPIITCAERGVHIDKSSKKMGALMNKKLMTTFECLGRCILLSKGCFDMVNE